MTVKAGHLSRSLAIEMGSRMRREDCREVELMGHDCNMAFLAGLNAGPAWAIIRHDGTSVGAFGHSSKGAVWALFTEDFNQEDAISLLKQAPAHIKRMRMEYGRTLRNWIPCDHRPMIRWLEATECFDVDYGNPVDIGGEMHYPFTTKKDLLDV